MTPGTKLPPHLVDAALRLLPPGTPGTLPIQGHSMEPTLPHGSEIVVDFNARAFRRGDLVVFRQGREVVVHRYLGRARADGNHSHDPVGIGFDQVQLTGHGVGHHYHRAVGGGSQAVGHAAQGDPARRLQSGTFIRRDRAVSGIGHVDLAIGCVDDMRGSWSGPSARNA